MSALPTIQQTIDIGNGSLPYALNNLYKGALYNKSISTQKSCTEIAMFTDILSWQYEALPSDSTLRGTANYLIWLCGMFGMQAQSASGGGSVIPINPNKPSIYPFVITSADFEDDGVSYNNPNIVGDNLELFPNQLNQQFWYAGQGFFVYTSSGIRIIYDGFNANTQSWTIRIDQVFGSGIPPVVENTLLVNTTDSILINANDSLLISA